MCTLRRLATAIAAVGIGLAATGCATTTNGSPALADHTGPLAAPPVGVAALDRSLLSTAEINAAMAATGMTVHTSRQDMWDDSPERRRYELRCGGWPGGGQDLHRARMDRNARPGTPRTR